MVGLFSPTILFINEPRGVAVAGDLGRAVAAVGLLEAEEAGAEVFGGVGVARVEGQHGVAHDVLGLAGKALLEERRELRHVELEHAGDEAEHVDVLALLLGGAADGLHGGGGHGNADGGSFTISLSSGLGTTWSES